MRQYRRICRSQRILVEIIRRIYQSGQRLLHKSMEMMKRVFTFTQVVGVNNVNTLVIALRSQAALYRFAQTNVLRRENIGGVIGTRFVHMTSALKD